MKKSATFCVPAALLFMVMLATACATPTPAPLADQDEGASRSTDDGVVHEPSEPEMRAAMQEYLEARTPDTADRPRYLNATRIHRFEKRGCRPADNGVLCGYLLEVGTTYRAARISTHLFEFVDGNWVSRGPVRPQTGDQAR